MAARMLVPLTGRPGPLKRLQSAPVCDLQARDPILFYDDVELYASDLDDHGAVQVAVKARDVQRLPNRTPAGLAWLSKVVIWALLLR